jgi:predicted lipoprotein with Yx(FWY)xxD motif
MKWRLAAALAAFLSCPAMAQPADLPIPAATTNEYPVGVSVAQTAAGPVYADSRGRTLYGMDMRTLLRAGADPSQYCQEACAQTWEPLLAPPGARVDIAYPQSFGERLRRELEASAPAAKPARAPRKAADESESDDGAKFYSNPQKAPDWTVIAGPQGPQWVYKGWHMVYVRKGDAPGSTRFDGAEDFTWNTLKYVPPVPRITAPPSVSTILVGGRYALADKDGRVLFTGDCGDNCAGWTPLTGGLASRGVGEWAVTRTGDAAQWTYRGKPVYVSRLDDPMQVPAAGVMLHP